MEIDPSLIRFICQGWGKLVSIQLCAASLLPRPDHAGKCNGGNVVDWVGIESSKDDLKPAQWEIEDMIASVCVCVWGGGRGGGGVVGGVHIRSEVRTSW